MAKILHLVFGIWLIVACFDGACCEGQDETTAATTLTTDDSSLTMNPLANETSPATDAADPATTLSPHDTSTAEPQSTNATNPTVPPEVADPCKLNPCGQGSTCDGRADGFVCLCLAGDYYNYYRARCESAKVFPGTLGFSNLTYTENMAEKSSEDFKNASEAVIKELSGTFNVVGNAYLNSTVIKIVPEGGSRVRAESNSGIEATVEIIFETFSKVNESFVKNAASAIGTGFEATNLCINDPNNKPCDISTSNCFPEDGSFNCKCKDGHILTKYSERTCSVCPGGFKAVNDQCVTCDFGYTGFNCEDEWQLILVIVGSVLGGLLLLTLILLPVVASRSSKKKTKGETGISYANSAFDKSPLVSNYNANAQAASRDGLVSAFTNNGAPRIPRATPVTRRDNLEMMPGASQRNEGLAGRNTMYDDEILPYSQSRSQSNNPYASVQDHGNPYSSDDNRRRF